MSISKYFVYQVNTVYYACNTFLDAHGVYSFNFHLEICVKYPSFVLVDGRVIMANHFL
jgi:hypothetical protein